MEMNTRIHEHPVTEMVTGIDLLNYNTSCWVTSYRIKQEDIKLTGHATEFRINAENPYKNFYAITR